MIERGWYDRDGHGTFAAGGEPSGAAQAHALMESNQHIGKIVLTW